MINPQGRHRDWQTVWLKTRVRLGTDNCRHGGSHRLPGREHGVGAGDTVSRSGRAAVTPGPPGTPACCPESDSKSHLPLTQALARAVSGPVPVTVTVLPG